MMNGPYVPALDRPSLAAANGAPSPSSPSSGGGCGCSGGSPASGAESSATLGAPPMTLPTPPRGAFDVRPGDETPAGSPIDVAGIGLGLLVGLLVGGVATYALTRD